jgi:hypothetical protein
MYFVCVLLHDNVRPRTAVASPSLSLISPSQGLANPQICKFGQTDGSYDVDGSWKRRRRPPPTFVDMRSLSMPALLVSLCYLLVLHQTHAFVSRSPIISTPSQGLVSSAASASTSTDTDALKIIFSDIDGSLIHYPKQHDKTQQNDNNKILELPPSATGLRGIISSQTLATCRDLRVKKGVKLVLVTGARTSTLLNRLPYLPKADAYCTEAGGRIFYPVDIDSNDEELFQSQLTYTPLEYSGAIADDLKPFGLREDRKWRERMELGGAGTEGYAGNEVSSDRCDESEDVECLIDYESTEGFPFLEDEVPITQRQGNLWDYANQLVEQEGFVLDTKSYSTCFRVNKKHQTNHKFDALLSGDIAHPEAKIGKSTNLGCIDFYPASSGKGNW